MSSLDLTPVSLSALDVDAVTPGDATARGPHEYGDTPVWDGSGWDFRVHQGEVQYVSADGGDDDAHGGTPFAPKATIEAAVAALPDGGTVHVAPGSYTPTGQITLAGHSIIGANALSAGAVAPSGVIVNHSFNGDLFEFASYGSTLRNLYLYNTGSFTGAAIKAVAGASDNIGFIRCENIVVTGTTSWEYDVYIDGSAATGLGIRSTYFTNCVFFGASTQFQTVYVKDVVHCFFTACEVITAPSATTVGFYVDGNFSTDVYVTGCSIAGKFYSAASGLLFTGYIPSTIECGSGSARNIFMGDVHSATFTNNGAATNVRVDSEARSYTYTVAQNYENGVGGSAATISGFRRLKLSGGGANATGLVELNNQLSVTDAHSFGAFPSPGAGAIYSHKGLLMAERTDPSAPDSNQAFLYTRDNGSGKTQLVVRFPTGAIQVIATEP